MTKNRRIQHRSQDFSPLPFLSKEPGSRLRRIFCISLKAPLTHRILYLNSVEINLPPSLAALWFVRLTSRAAKIALLEITKAFLKSYYDLNFVKIWFLIHSISRFTKSLVRVPGILTRNPCNRCEFRASTKVFTLILRILFFEIY